MSDSQIAVEVAFAAPDKQLILSVKVDDGTSVESAIKQSGILSHFPEINLSRYSVGIFSRVCKLNQSLRIGERVEIYRPLIADPKESRRQRADKKQQKIVR